MLQNINRPEKKGMPLMISLRNIFLWVVVIIFSGVGCAPPGDAPAFTYNLNTGVFSTDDSIDRLYLTAYNKEADIMYLEVYCSENDTTGINNFKLPLFDVREIEKINHCNIHIYDTALVEIFKSRKQEIRFFFSASKANSIRKYTTDTIVNFLETGDSVITFSYNYWN